jgi:hypothetical protein
VLPPNALARAAHDLAGRMVAGEIPHGHLDTTVPRASQPDTRTTKKRKISIFGER